MSVMNVMLAIGGVAFALTFTGVMVALVRTIFFPRQRSTNHHSAAE